ncbi:hypothetical protein ABW21_db0200221 [Orbilia brochopaga]|nr:hypothetical protein ABW21_db0200221 [Drechslerella brochopaga]
MHKAKPHRHRHGKQGQPSSGANADANEAPDRDVDGTNEKPGDSGAGDAKNDDNELSNAQIEAYADEFANSDEIPIEWWFAAKGVPLIAATIGPLANLTSVAALVGPWRANLPTKGENAYDERFGVAFLDPTWYA